MRPLIAILVLICACSDDGVSHLPDAQPAALDAPPTSGGRTCATTAPTGIGPDGQCAWAFSCDGGDRATDTYAVHCDIAAAGFTCVCTVNGVAANTITVADACMAATDMCSIANEGCGWQPTIDCP